MVLQKLKQIKGRRGLREESEEGNMVILDRIVPIECMKLVLYIEESLQNKKKQKRKIQKL